MSLVADDGSALTRYNRAAGAVFDLLGHGEVDLTAAVGWTLASCPSLMAGLLTALGLEGEPQRVAVALERPDELGRTDIELTSETWKVVIEAKQGWLLPGEDQLQRYVGRFDGFDGMLVTMSDSSTAWASTALPAEVGGVSVQHQPWDTIRHLIRDARKTARPAERLWLNQLERYMGTATSRRPYDDQWVYCVVVADALYGGLSFRDYVTTQRRYFHPYGGRNGWPRRPPNLLGFRWGGQVRQLNRVQDVEVVRSLRDLWPDMTEDDAATPHIVYTLGADIPIPQVATTGTYATARVWCLLDQLLTHPTLKSAKEASDSLLAKHQ